jgi:cell division protein FtsB
VPPFSLWQNKDEKNIAQLVYYSQEGVILKMDSPQKKERPIVITLYIIFWSAILIMFGGLFVGQMENYNELQSELTRLNASIAEEEATSAQLQTQLSFFDSDAYMEYLARRRGMVRENEIIFRNVAE